MGRLVGWSGLFRASTELTHDIIRLLLDGGDLHLVLLGDRVLVRTHRAQELCLYRALLDLLRRVVVMAPG